MNRMVTKGYRKGVYDRVTKGMGELGALAGGTLLITGAAHEVLEVRFSCWPDVSIDF